MMEFHIDGLDEFMTALERAPATVREEMEPAMDDSLEMVQRRLRPPRRTGKLAGRWFRAVKTDTSGVTGSLYTDVFYGTFQEFGTKFLAARAFLERAMRSAAGDVEIRLGQALERVFQRMAR